MMDERPQSQAGELHPCGICGRSFFPEALVRHQRVCERQAQKKPRKVFNMQKQRLQGTEMEQMGKTGALQKAPAPAAKKTGNWRKNHEDFISAIRNARQVTQALKTGGPLPPPAPPAENPDYVKCDFCGRRFREEAAQRHIPFCKEKAQRISNVKPPSDKAKEKLVKRNAYRAPLPGTKKRTSMEGAAASEPQGYQSHGRAAPGHPPTGAASMGQRNGMQHRDAAASRAGQYSQRTGPGAPSGPAGAATGRTGVPRNRPPAGPSSVSQNGAAASQANGSRTRVPGTGRQAAQRVPSRNGPMRANGHDYLASPEDGGHYATPTQQQQQKTQFSSRRGQHQRNGSVGAPPKATSSRQGLNSTYTVRRDASRVPSNGDMNGEMDEYGHEDYAQPLSRTSTSARQAKSSHTRGREPDYNPGQYEGGHYRESPALPSGLGASPSTSGVSDLGSDISLPPIASSRTKRGQSPTMRASHGTGNGGGSGGGAGGSMSKFCYNCGTQFPVPHAKYCCECGTKRIVL